MTKHINRRTICTAAAVLIAGCVGTDTSTDGPGEGDGNDTDENIDTNTDDNEGDTDETPDESEGAEDTETETEVEPSGSISVSPQEGQGKEVHIDEAEANVQYQLVIEYEEATLKTDPIDPETTVSQTFNLDSPIQSQQPVTAKVVTTDGEELDSGTFQYKPIPAGPKLTSSDARDILHNRTGAIGPWPVMEEFQGDPVIGSNDTGYTVQFGWVHDTWDDIPVIGDRAAATEERVAWANAAFFQALYQSEYEIQNVEIQTFHYRGVDTVGDPVIDRSGKVVVSHSSAQRVTWDNLVDDGTFPDALRQVADQYEFTFHEPVED